MTTQWGGALLRNFNCSIFLPNCMSDLRICVSGNHHPHMEGAMLKKISV